MHAGLQTTHIYLLSGESESETTLARQEHHFDIYSKLKSLELVSRYPSSQFIQCNKAVILLSSDSLCS